MSGCLEIEVSLKHIRPRIWRRFLLNEQATFADLHRAIQDAFGWMSCHLWEFQAAGRHRESIAGVPDDGFGWGEPTPDAEKVLVTAYLGRAARTCVYLYDFGDDWEHTVKLTRTVEQDAWRVLLAGRRSAPPEDCGGVPGYEDCVAVASGESTDEDLAEWLGDWDPDGWSLAAAKARFDRIRPPTPPRRRSGGSVRATITALLADPPEDMEALEAILGGLNRSSARKALAELLASGEVLEQSAELVMAAFSILGVGQQVRRLETVATSADQPIWARALAIGSLSSQTPEIAERALAAFTEADQEAFFLHSVRSAALQAYAEDPDLLVENLSAVDDEMRDGILSALAVMRRELGLPASGLYQALWQAPGLSMLRPRIRAALIAEGSTTARILLAGDAPALARAAAGLQEVLPGLDEIPAPPAAALIGTCDGQGAINVFVTVGREELLLAGLCIRAAEGVRDSWILPRQTREDVDDICQAFMSRAHVRFASVPVDVAVGLVEGALARDARAGRRLEGDAFRAAALILHHGTAARLPAPPIRAVTLQGCRELLARPEYAAWFFDRMDLEQADAPMPPSAPREVAAWVRLAAGKLDSPQLRTRLIGMTGHMARWHHLVGEAEPAGICQGALVRLSGGLSEHPLVWAMLERTAEIERSALSSGLTGGLTLLMDELD
jgi:hypothetical protein